MDTPKNQPQDYPPKLTPALELKAYRLHHKLRGRLNIDLAKQIIAEHAELQEYRAQDAHRRRSETARK